ncbi:tetratricopeptide repeat protein [Thermomonas sp.]|uniref:tetratricopeptide repeat protein n=1 Tax=Thermomonas sp. TaxID=1971895 RepID=UPI00248A2E2E|nr:tetratricopeptide repeat protein [Thermomonas sp.]MDI1252011.1 tetratricopeptide repeat protein [Thermomonas sp.]
MITDDGLLIKPEPRKPRALVIALAALAVAALLAGGYFAYARFGASGSKQAQVSPAPPAATAGAAAGQLPSTIIAVLPLAGERPSENAKPFVEDSSERLVEALKARRDDAGYFNDGLSNQLIAGLSQFAGVAVTSPESSFQFRDSRELGRAIGKKLGATHVLQGSVQRKGDDVLIDASLVRVSDGSTLWFDHYQRPYKNLFKLQDEILVAIGSALKTKRLPAPQGSQDERPPGGNLAAYDAVLRGNALYDRHDGDGSRQAIAAFERAVALDPNYAEAYARLALARIQLATRFPSEAGDVREEGEKARREAALALRMAPNRAEVHAANAAWMSGIALDQAGAMHETLRALELSPQDPGLLHSLAIQQTAFGQLEEAAGNLRRVLALNPLSSSVLYNLGGVYLGKNDFSEAEYILGQALALRPDTSVVRAFQAIAVFQQNRADEAIKLAESEPDPLWRTYALAMAYWAKGDRGRSDVELQSLIRDNANNAATQIAGIYAQRDDETSMFHWLDVARTSGDPGIVEIRYMPFVSRYSSDPRFIALARELDLMPEEETRPSRTATPTKP